MTSKVSKGSEAWIQNAVYKISLKIVKNKILMAFKNYAGIMEDQKKHLYVYWIGKQILSVLLKSFTIGSANNSSKLEPYFQNCYVSDLTGNGATLQQWRHWHHQHLALNEMSKSFWRFLLLQSKNKYIPFGDWQIKTYSHCIPHTHTQSTITKMQFK